MYIYPIKKRKQWILTFACCWYKLWLITKNPSFLFLRRLSSLLDFLITTKLSSLLLLASSPSNTKVLYPFFLTSTSFLVLLGRRGIALNILKNKTLQKNTYKQWLVWSGLVWFGLVWWIYMYVLFFFSICLMATCLIQETGWEYLLCAFAFVRIWLGVYTFYVSTTSCSHQ